MIEIGERKGVEIEEISRDLKRHKLPFAIIGIHIAADEAFDQKHAESGWPPALRMVLRAGSCLTSAIECSMTRSSSSDN